MTLRVIAAPGLAVPREGQPRSYIGATPVEVPLTPYYRRLLADGDLLPAPAGSAKQAAKKE
ncbi:DUF2635 domain-containing protein [Chitiniphilus eburneus]|uniref:DUF2635 domain-containing protein n=1 Tax=Chitiniphilus eburneus TaxID=2571148 RepID=UPI0035CF9F9E